MHGPRRPSVKPNHHQRARSNIARYNTTQAIARGVTAQDATIQSNKATEQGYQTAHTHTHTRTTHTHTHTTHHSLPHQVTTKPHRTCMTTINRAKPPQRKTSSSWIYTDATSCKARFKHVDVVSLCSTLWCVLCDALRCIRFVYCVVSVLCCALCCVLCCALCCVLCCVLEVARCAMMSNDVDCSVSLVYVVLQGSLLCVLTAVGWSIGVVCIALHLYAGLLCFVLLLHYSDETFNN